MNYLLPVRKLSPLGAVLGAALILTGCFTPTKEKQIQSEMFGLQTRILQLESLILEKDQKAVRAGKKSNQKFASTTTQVDKLAVDVRKLQGEVDRLEEGIKTGVLPGQSEDDPSVKSTLDSISQRIDALEANQNELIDLRSRLIKNLESENKAKAKKKALAAKAKKDKARAAAKAKANKISNFSGLKSAFGRKQFKKVAQNGEAVYKKQKSKAQKVDALYYTAESMYKTGQIKSAALHFNEMLENYPSTKWAAHSRMRLGDSFRRLGDKTTAKIYYEELIEKHPSSTEAQRAKARLQKL